MSRAFLNDVPQTKRNFPAEYDGKRLDQLTIAATVTSVKDVEELIKYLEIHKYCFLKPEHYEQSKLSK